MESLGRTEKQLRLHLLAVLAVMKQATGWSEATLGDELAKDWRFFTRQRERHPPSFTARKYDVVMAKAAELIAERGAKWPAGIPRPEPRKAAA